MIESDYWICALIDVLWLYVLFISFRKLSVISSNCNRMLNRKHGMENTTAKGDEEFQWLQSLRIEHWFDVHNIKIVSLKAVELNILAVNPKLNVSLKCFFKVDVDAFYLSIINSYSGMINRTFLHVMYWSETPLTLTQVKS